MASEGMPLVPLLRRTIDALTRVDVAELELCLRSTASMISAPQGEELAEARSLHRLLGALLRETQRNLRLVRRAANVRGAGSYGATSF